MHTMNDVMLYDFQQHGDDRGHLVVVEGVTPDGGVTFLLR